MEVEENEEDELAELCAEILENCTSPICSDLGQNSIHQNPFSLQHPIYPPQLNNAYDDEFIRKVEINPINGPQVSLHALSCSTNLETNDEARTGSDNSTGDMDFDFELEQKPDRVMKERRAVGMALNKTYEKSSKDEPAQKPNDTVSVDRPIIPVLVADTFSDKLLGHGVDGIGIADLNKVKEAKECDEAGDHLRTILNENDAVPEASTLSINNGKEMGKLNFSQRLSGFESNFCMMDRMTKGFYDENRPMPATSIAAPTKINGFITKSKFSIPSNKTIFDVDIDNIEEKLWRTLGVDMSDFFNYGLDENQWKGYCKLMKARVQLGSSVQSEIPGGQSIQPHKEWTRSEVKLNTGVDECLPFADSNDRGLNDSDVIIEIVKEDDVLADAECANHLLDNRNTENTKCRMINGDKILPFPMDCYSRKIKQHHRRSCGKETVGIAASNEMGIERELYKSRVRLSVGQQQTRV